MTSNQRRAQRPATPPLRGFWARALHSLAACVLLSTPVILSGTRALAQENVGGRSEVFAGSELENYLRYLQSAGKSREYPWTVRGFSPSEIDALAPVDTAHPWASRYSLGLSQGVTRLDYVRPRLDLHLNSSFPHGGNDGAVWAGKGLTTSFRAGIAARYGPLSITLAPVAFRAENRSFPLLPNGESGRLRFAHGQFPLQIDLPQRYGTLPYSRLDPGQSTVRLDIAGFATGISTANQWWGPASDYPYVLGNNAAGIPHVFFGTARPANLWLFKAHTRLIYGRLDQSAYSSVTGSSHFTSFAQPGRKRFVAGLIATFQPRGVPGLEFGGTRFFHAAEDSSGISSRNLKLPFQQIFKFRLSEEEFEPITGDNRGNRENQLASLFLRWAPPGSGLDVYGEYGREDHSGDERDLLMQFDHASTVSFGIRKAWLAPKLLHAVRAEIFTYSLPAGARVRDEGAIYLHGILRQGHTNRGQSLGADVGPGSGSAQILAYDRYTTAGRLTGFLSRVVQHELTTLYVSGPPTFKPVDVVNSVGAEVTRFIGPFDVMARVVLSLNVNRNFTSDQANGNLVLGVRQNF